LEVPEDEGYKEEEEDVEERKKKICPICSTPNLWRTPGLPVFIRAGRKY